MSHQQPKTKYLKDYQPPHYFIETTELKVDLGEDSTLVTAKLMISRNHAIANAEKKLVLDGKEITLKSIAIDGKQLTTAEYSVDEEHLTLHKVPDHFLLETVAVIKPQLNTALIGLYKSSGNFCTQCEAEGFRKITYFLDRPDVLSIYTVTITADKKHYPVLLSNGNLMASGDLGNGRHWAKWHDPFKKPSYLFALVAGDLREIEDKYVTMSGKTVTLKIFVEKGNEDKCAHAMQSLKHAMRWDEETYQREYDLDILMIVAVSDFNMGAMENKGLNIFNSQFILANPQTATDQDFQAIESVVGHEYFHNWTGNRITCRDWFQLSLKEGLTIFREQEFCGAMWSQALVRINEVRLLRTRQFSEDAGPMAHPVQPNSYIEISNFYTTTVYHKGAEVIRMMRTLIGLENFNRGMQLYFELHDGQAATIEDFVQAMQDASGEDLAQFKLWYKQAGTPELTVETDYDAVAKVYTLTVKQTHAKVGAKPFHLPLTVGLLDKQGRELMLQLENTAANNITTMVLPVKKPVETFRFINVLQKPIPSLLRNFSAPVKLNVMYSDEELMLLLAYDPDDFNRWFAGQQLAIKTLKDLIALYQQGKSLQLKESFIDVYRNLLSNEQLDKSLLAELLILPSEGYLAELYANADVDAIYHAREFVSNALARQLKQNFLTVYKNNYTQTAYNTERVAVSGRSLKNVCLSYLLREADASLLQLCMQQFNTADNMTDVLTALSVLAHVDCPEREQALNIFYKKWSNDPLVINKWFAVQAISRLPDTLQHVKRLTQHEAFDIKNPNKVRALLGTFCHRNFKGFHAKNGESYELLGDYVILIDPLNPQLAAHMVEPLIHWRRFDPIRQELMRKQLVRINSQPKLSKDVYEMVAKSLDYDKVTPSK